MVHRKRAPKVRKGRVAKRGGRKGRKGGVIASRAIVTKTKPNDLRVQTRKEARIHTILPQEYIIKTALKLFFSVPLGLSSGTFNLAYASWQPANYGAFTNSVALGTYLTNVAGAFRGGTAVTQTPAGFTSLANTALYNSYVVLQQRTSIKAIPDTLADNVYVALAPVKLNLATTTSSQYSGLANMANGPYGRMALCQQGSNNNRGASTLVKASDFIGISNTELCNNVVYGSLYNNNFPTVALATQAPAIVTIQDWLQWQFHWDTVSGAVTAGALGFEIVMNSVVLLKELADVGMTD